MTFRDSIEELARKARPTTAGEVRRFVTVLMMIAIVVSMVWFIYSSIFGAVTGAVTDLAQTAQPTTQPIAQPTATAEAVVTQTVDSIDGFITWLTGIDSSGGLTYKKLGGDAVLDIDTKDVLICKGEIPFSCEHTIYWCGNVNMSELYIAGSYTEICQRQDLPENRRSGAPTFIPECVEGSRLHFAPSTKEYSCK